GADEWKLRTRRLGGIGLIDAASSLVASVIKGRSDEVLFSALGPTNTIEDRERLSAVELQYMRKGGTYHITAGLSFYRNRTDLEFFGEPSNVDTTERSAYAQ